MFHLLSSCSDSRLHGTWVCDLRPQGGGVLTIINVGNKSKSYANGTYCGEDTISVKGNDLSFIAMDKSVVYGTLTSLTSMVINFNGSKFFYYKTNTP